MNNKKIRNYKNNETLNKIIHNVIPKKRSLFNTESILPTKRVYYLKNNSKKELILEPYISTNPKKFENIQINTTKNNIILSGSFALVYVNIKSKNNKKLDNIVFKIINDERKTEFKSLIFHYLLQKYYILNKSDNIKYLCSLHEFGNIKNNNKTYAIMENCGIDLFYYLEDIMNYNRDLDPKYKFEKLLKLFSECCKAVKTIHDLGYLHLDIKPENFLIKDGQIKIIDFGLVRKHGYKTNIVFGTPNYVSNDWLKNAYSQPAKETTLEYYHDIFSLGCLFIYILYNYVFKINIIMGCPLEGKIGNNVNFTNYVLQKRLSYDDKSFITMKDNIFLNLNSIKIHNNILIINLIDKIVNPIIDKRYNSIDNVLNHIDTIKKNLTKRL